MKKNYLFTLLVLMCLALTTGFSQSDYNGTGTVTQGLGTSDMESLLDCTNGRQSPVGTIMALDGTIWTVPADVLYANDSFPFAPDLENPCNGNSFASAQEAFDNFDDADIVKIDQDGELITAYIFADNYFELYINGSYIGKDPVPFTQFNSNIVRFRVNRPFTIAMLLVDWEENLGLGSEDNRGSAYHPGDGGLVAYFVDENGEFVAKTDDSWKAQTFYTAPIQDLSCTSEEGSSRLSVSCSTDGVSDGSSFYGLHWAIPEDWNTVDYDDTDWPSATTYTNEEIGVNNKAAYTNFADVFDADNDAEFIWSTNVVLDNEVIVRYTVSGGTSSTSYLGSSHFHIYPNPASDFMFIESDNDLQSYIYRIFDMGGKLVRSDVITNQISLRSLSNGVYFVQVQDIMTGDYFFDKIVVNR